MPTSDPRATTAEAALILSISDLRVHFPVYRGLLFQKLAATVRAVDGVSIDVREGEVLGLVGESGSGKTTLGRAVLGLARAQSGSIRYKGVDLTRLSPGEFRPYRSEIQIIFQDPYSSLNPRMTVFDILAEPLKVHESLPSDEIQKRVAAMLDCVGLAAAYMGRYPHEFSGGQRQRIAIARALMVRPKLVIADEPVSALDVSIQAQILNLLSDLRTQFKLTMIFISHDLAVVRHVSDRVAVMYLGKIAELAGHEQLYSRPAHPYTQALISAAPTISATERRQRIILKGNIPSPSDPPPGCRFHTRCPHAESRCKAEEPPLEIVSENHQSACWFASRWA